LRQVADDRSGIRLVVLIDASADSTEGLDLCAKKVKRCGHGFRTVEH
jgi:hypothetical protein